MCFSQLNIERQERKEGLYLLGFCAAVLYLPWRFGRVACSYDRCHAGLSKSGALFACISVTRP